MRIITVVLFCSHHHGIQNLHQDIPILTYTDGYFMYDTFWYTLGIARELKDNAINMSVLSS